MLCLDCRGCVCKGSPYTDWCGVFPMGIPSQIREGIQRCKVVNPPRLAKENEIISKQLSFMDELLASVD